MSSSCAGLPTSFDRFRQIWDHDFEFRQDDNHQPVPVALFAKEHRTGTKITMRREQLLACSKAPFDIGPDTLITSYSIVAELSCFRVLHWPLPRNLLCTYFETCAAINGLDIVGLSEKRPGLLAACDLFGIPHGMTAENKDRMRDLILNNADYAAAEWREIADYNRDDVFLSMPLPRPLAPTIALPAALFRGRYAKAVVDMEQTGIPIAVDYLTELQDQWQALRMFYIHRDDEFGLYDEAGSFREDRMEALIKAREWTTWPRTGTGRLELKSRIIGKQARHHPELRSLQK